MSRTLSAGLTGHIATSAHTRATMLRLDLSDGTSIGITDHDKDLAFNLGDGSITYDASTGILTSDVALSTGLESDNFEVTGPIADVVTRAGILGGRYDRARARLFQVNWTRLADGAIKIMEGNVSDARMAGGRFIFEIRSNIDRLNQPVGRLIVNNCDADFGDARCGATPTTQAGTVTAVTDAMRFTVDNPGAYANDYFNMGTVIGLTGENTGTTVEIFDWTVGGAITLFSPLGVTPSVGDTFTVKRGCGKSRADCMARNNIVNFRGYPEVPGSDQILRATIPGQGNED